VEAHISAVESAYEFLLAYAAQGRDDDADGPGPKSREVLTALDASLGAIAQDLDPATAFSEVVADDIAKTRKALALVLAQPRISSELVDNLNASMHLRAVLTDLFLVSEAGRLGSTRP